MVVNQIGTTFAEFPSKELTQKINLKEACFIRLKISRTKHINLPKNRLKKSRHPFSFSFDIGRKKVRGSEMGPLSLKTPMHYYAHLACETSSIRSFLGANKNPKASSALVLITVCNALRY